MIADRRLKRLAWRVSRGSRHLIISLAHPAFPSRGSPRYIDLGRPGTLSLIQVSRRASGFLPRKRKTGPNRVRAPHLSREIIMLADRYGLALSTTSPAARDAYVQASDLLLTMYPGAIDAFERAIAADPGFALAHAGKAQMLLAGGNTAAAR